MKLLIVTFLFMASCMHALAGAGKEAVLTGVSSNGHAKLEVKIWDVNELEGSSEAARRNCLCR